jgi:hypothetical protein
MASARTPVWRRTMGDAAIQSREVPYVPLACFAIARPEGRASFDALGLAMTTVVRSKRHLL